MSGHVVHDLRRAAVVLKSRYPGSIKFVLWPSVFKVDWRNIAIGLINRPMCTHFGKKGSSNVVDVEEELCSLQALRFPLSHFLLAIARHSCTGQLARVQTFY